MKSSSPPTLTALALAGLLLATAATPVAAQAAASACPALGWDEGLGQYQKPTASIPTNTNKPDPEADCRFHEWSWEAYVWATALDAAGVPRFLRFPTPEDLLSKRPRAAAAGARSLKLGTRSLLPHGAPGFTEGATAIVEADGNLMVAPNGYPVYASVHMNPSYFATARRNLIATGGYGSQPADAYFSVGDAVFKATWMRLDPGQPAPAGAFTTQARVPVLHVSRSSSSQYSVVPTGQTVTATVALVGLHVVGYTVNHPEFLWATFEHNLNTPATADGTFSPGGSDPKGYTFYAANTPFSQVNQPNPSGQNQTFVPPPLSFDPVTQKFSPPTNAVQQNATGGENLSGGPANIAALNASGQRFLAGQKAPQSSFASYRLIGTVWMAPNSYVGPAALTMGQKDAVGSVRLANTTAETFVQGTGTGPTLGCFSCHNPSSYNFQEPPPKLASRRIAISHVLGVGTSYAVSNQVTVPTVSTARPAAPAK